MGRGEYYDGGFRRSRRRRGEPAERKRSGGMAIVDGLALLLTVVSAVALVIALLAPYVHPERLWMLPVLGLVAPAVYVGVLFSALYWIVRWRWRVALPLIVLLVVGAFKVSLFLKIDLRRDYGTEQSYGSGTITLMTYNVRNFYDDTHRRSFDRVADLVRRVNPDVVCLQEFNRDEEQAARMDSLLTGYTRVRVSDRTYAYMAIYTKFRILGEGQMILKSPPVNGQSEQIDLGVGNDTLRIVGNHLHSTAITVHDDEFLTSTQLLTDTAGGQKVRNIFRRFGENSAVRARQADTISRAMAGTRVPMVVCGDFNDTPMSYVYRRMARGLSDAFSERGKGYSHTFRGFMNALRIDYVLYNGRLECLSYEVLDDVELSDHHPVVVRLKMK